MRFSVRSQNDEIILRTARHGQKGWYLSAYDGWEGTPAPREKGEIVYGRDADMWPTTLTQGARTVTLSGFARCESSVEGARCASRIDALFGQKLEVVGEGADGAKRTWGFLSDDPRIRFAKRGCIVVFDLLISCPDPHRYGDVQTFWESGGLCRVANEGTIGSWPKIRVKTDGALTYLTVSLGSQRVSWNGNTKSLVLDFADMVPSTGTVTYDDAFLIPPGRSEIEVSCNAGASVAIDVAPAWR